MIYKTRAKALSWLLALAMLVGLMPGMSLTAYAADYENIEITSAVYDATSVSTLKDSLDGFCKLSFEEAKSWDPPTKSGNVRLIRDYGEDYIRVTIFVNGQYVNDAGITLEMAKAYDEFKYYYAKKTVVAVNSVTLSPATVTLTAGGEAVAMTATVSPDNATDKKVKWSVGGTDTGAVKLYFDADCTTEVGANATATLTVYAKGISAGSATVTATSNVDSEKKASCDVTVNVAAPTVTISPAIAGTVATTWEGANWILTATANDGYKFKEWTYTLGGSSFRSNINPDTQSHLGTISSITANFVGTITITDGTATIKANGRDYQLYNGSYINYNTGTVITITANAPETGKVFDKWTTTTEGLTFASETSATTTFTMPDKPVVITATYKADLPPVTITAMDKEVTYSTDGIVIPVDGMFTITEGAGVATYTVENGTGEGTFADGKLTVTKCGTFTVKVSTAATDTHAAGAETTATLTVNKADPTVTAPTAKTLTYNGSAQELVTAGEATGGEMYYAVTTENTAPTNESLYTTSIPSKTEAGTYYVWYKAVGDANHSDCTAACVTVTISAASTPAPTPSVPSTPSSSDSSPSTPAATTITVPVSSDTQSVSVTASVSGETATVQKPTTAQLEQIVGESVHTGEVTIDVSGLGKEITTVSIPTETVKAVEQAVNDAANDATGMTVKLSEGSVTFDGQALTAITEQATGNNIQLNLDGIGENKLSNTQQAATKDMDVQAVYDAYITSNGQRISDFKGGKATVTVPYELKAEQRAAGVTVWYVADNGNTTEMPSTYDGKEVKFTVKHFSNYVIAYDEARAAVCPQDSTCPISAFTDADPTAWYHDGVHWALENGVMNGVGGNTFAPNGTTSRAQVATMLYRLAGSPQSNGKIAFSDVAEGMWYTEAIRWTSSVGVVTGFERDGASVFDPDAAVTREQFAAMLYRYAKLNGQGFTGAWMFPLDYPDAASVSEWADEAMHWMTMQGVINGIDGKLVPQGEASRAMVATMLMRYCTEIAG